MLDTLVRADSHQIDFDVGRFKMERSKVIIIALGNLVKIDSIILRSQDKPLNYFLIYPRNYLLIR